MDIVQLCSNLTNSASYCTFCVIKTTRDWREHDYCLIACKLSLVRIKITIAVLGATGQYPALISTIW